jgi:hypothetical protein
VAASAVSGGEFSGTASGPHPYLLSAAIEKPALDDKVVFRLRNGTNASSAQLYFTTKPDGSWTQRKGGRIAILPNSNYHLYEFDMSAVPKWAGTITRVRLDPVNADGPFAVDWIRIGNVDCTSSPGGCAPSTTVAGTTDDPVPGFPVDPLPPVSNQSAAAPAADTTPPRLSSCTKRRQNLARSAIRLCVQSSEPVSLSAGGSLTTGQVRRRAGRSKTIGLPTVRVAKADLRAEFSIRLSKRARRSLVKTLRSGGRASASLAVTATDAAGNRAKLAMSVSAKKLSRHRR